MLFGSHGKNLMFLTILHSYEQNIHLKKHTTNKKHFLFLCHLKAQIQNPLEKLSENMPGLSIKAIWKEEKKEERVNKSRFVEKERERW